MLIPGVLLAVGLGMPPVVGDTACLTTASSASLAKRPSPLDSVSFVVASSAVKICYGRPSSRGRTMIGGRNVPYGHLWRTGANEPTMLHTTGPITVAGIVLNEGVYSIYTIPGEQSWVLLLNRSTEQWGDEVSYKEVKHLEVGQAVLERKWPRERVEQFTITVERPGRDDVTLVFLWETSRVEVPVTGGRLAAGR